jgi:hypothetical protein
MQAYGQPINATSSSNPEFFWQLNFADWFGILVGSAGLGLAIAIYFMQRRAERRFNKLQEDQILRSYKGIYNAALLAKHRLEDIHDQVVACTPDANPLQVHSHVLSFYRFGFEENIALLKEEADYLRPHISEKFHTKVGACIVVIRRLIEPQGPVENSAYLPHWLDEAKYLIKTLEDIMATLETVATDYETKGVIRRI